jgi:enamine deaminase RidA (YjgF/YER057c/UK114 family)
MKTIPFFISTIALFSSCNSAEPKQKETAMKTGNKVEFINPDGLHKNPAFSQVAVVSGHYKTVYIGGQDAVDKDGNLVGKGNIEEQAKQVLSNLQTALQAGGAGLEHVVKWNVYIAKGQSAQQALKAFQEPLKTLKNPPLITGIFVESLANPDYLLEMEAIAIVPEQ